jgi:hypothetical protein
MANILGRQTINNLHLLEVNVDPSGGGGTIANLGSLASVTDGSGLFLKTGSGTTAWSSLAGASAVGGTGAIQFANGTSFNGDAANLFWNNSTKQFGVGTNTPSATFSVASSTGDATISIATTEAESDASLFLDSGNAQITLKAFDASAGGSLTFAGTGPGIIENTASGSLSLKTGASTRIHITNSGNVGVGNTSAPALLSAGTLGQFQVDTTGNLVITSAASAAQVGAVVTTSDTDSSAYMEVSNTFGGWSAGIFADAGSAGFYATTPTFKIDTVSSPTTTVFFDSGTQTASVNSPPVTRTFAKHAGVGIGRAPESMLDVHGSFGLEIFSANANYTLTPHDHTVFVDATGGNRTITLPTASTCARRRYEIKKIDSSANTVTVDGYSSETIDGSLTNILSTQYQSVTVVSDGAGWNTVSQAGAGSTITGSSTNEQVIVGAGTNIIGSSSSLTFASNILNVGDSGGDARIQLKSSGAALAQIQATASEARFSSIGAIPWVAHTNGVERLRITSSGSLQAGGTTGSDVRMYITHSGGSSVTLRAENTSATASLLELYDSGTARFVSTGQGITTLTPSTTSNAVLRIFPANTQASAGIIQVSYANAVTQTGTINGISLNLSSNVTPLAGSTITGTTISLPTISTISGATTINGHSVSGGTVTNGTAGSITWNGLNITNPNITQNSGGSSSATALRVLLGSNTTNGSQQGLDIDATAQAAGTVTGINVGSLTGGPLTGGNNVALSLGANWDLGISSSSPVLISSGDAIQTGVGVFTGLMINNNNLFAQAASTEITDISLGGGANLLIERAPGAVTTQRTVRIPYRAYTFTSGSNTITTAATLSIDAAPRSGANAIITHSAGLLIQGVNLASGGTVLIRSARPTQFWRISKLRGALRRRR